MADGMEEEEHKRKKEQKHQHHLLREMHSLTKEVCSLKKQLSSQADTSTIILYASIADVIILLVIVSQSQSKLHSATEALLLSLRRS